jgi:hypothetical protein
MAIITTVWLDLAVLLPTEYATVHGLFLLIDRAKDSDRNVIQKFTSLRGGLYHEIRNLSTKMTAPCWRTERSNERSVHRTHSYYNILFIICQEGVILL